MAINEKGPITNNNNNNNNLNNVEDINASLEKVFNLELSLKDLKRSLEDFKAGKKPCKTIIFKSDKGYLINEAYIKEVAQFICFEDRSNIEKLKIEIRQINYKLVTSLIKKLRLAPLRLPKIIEFSPFGGSSNRSVVDPLVSLATHHHEILAIFVDKNYCDAGLFIALFNNQELFIDEFCSKGESELKRLQKLYIDYHRAEGLSTEKKGDSNSDINEAVNSLAKIIESLDGCVASAEKNIKVFAYSGLYKGEEYIEKLQQKKNKIDEFQQKYWSFLTVLLSQTNNLDEADKISKSIPRYLANGALSIFYAEKASSLWLTKNLGNDNNNNLSVSEDEYLEAGTYYIFSANFAYFVEDKLAFLNADRLFNQVLYRSCNLGFLDGSIADFFIKSDSNNLGFSKIHTYYAKLDQVITKLFLKIQALISGLPEETRLKLTNQIQKPLPTDEPNRETFYRFFVHPDTQLILHRNFYNNYIFQLQQQLEYNQSSCNKKSKVNPEEKSSPTQFFNIANSNTSSPSANHRAENLKPNNDNLAKHSKRKAKDITEKSTNFLDQNNQNNTDGNQEAIFKM